MPAFKKVNPVGRKLKLTAELIKEICNMLRAGAYVETAAAVAGVSKDTLHTWLRKGRYAKGDNAGKIKTNIIYGQLIIAVEQAVEECVMRDLLVIDRAANPPQNAIMLKNEKGEQLRDKDGLELFIKPQPPDWSAAAWRLERRHGTHWRRVDKIELNRPPEDEANSVPRMSKEEMRKILDELESEI